MNTDHEKYMREALKEARRAEAEGEIPIGAVVVCEGRIIARAHNQTETLHDPTAHAEMLHRRQIPARMHSLRHSRAVSDVRRRHGLDSGRGSGLRCGRPQARLHPFFPVPAASEDKGLQRNTGGRVRCCHDRFFQEDKKIGQWIWNFCSTSATSACSSAPS